MVAQPLRDVAKYAEPSCPSLGRRRSLIHFITVGLFHRCLLLQCIPMLLSSNILTHVLTEHVALSDVVGFSKPPPGTLPRLTVFLTYQHMAISGPASLDLSVQLTASFSSSKVPQSSTFWSRSSAMIQQSLQNSSVLLRKPFAAWTACST